MGSSDVAKWRIRPRSSIWLRRVNPFLHSSCREIYPTAALPTCNLLESINQTFLYRHRLPHPLLRSTGHCCICKIIISTRFKKLAQRNRRSSCSSYTTQDGSNAPDQHLTQGSGTLAVDELLRACELHVHVAVHTDEAALVFCLSPLEAHEDIGVDPTKARISGPSQSIFFPQVSKSQ